MNDVSGPRQHFQFGLRKLFWLTAIIALIVSPLAFKNTIFSVAIYSVLSLAIATITILVLLIVMLGALFALAVAIRSVMRAIVPKQTRVQHHSDRIE